MSRSASIPLVFGDGEHTFRLGIGQLAELDEKCDAGPMEQLARMQAGTWRIKDLRETIRLGLIGGGLPAADAFRLVQRYVDERPLAESVPIAMAVLYACVVGDPGDEPGEGEAGTETATDPAASSTSPDSTAAARPSGGRRAKSTPAASGNSEPPSTGG
jgi:hypothetical protein